MLSKYLVGLKRDLIILLVGYLSYAIGQWLILFILLKNNHILAGEYSYALALTGPLITFSFLQLRTLFISDAKEKYKIELLFLIRILTTIIVISSFFILSYFLNKNLSTIITILMIGISRSLEGFCDLSYGIYQKNNQITKMGRSLMLRGFVPLFIVILLSYYSLLNFFVYINFLGVLLIVYFDIKNFNLIKIKELLSEANKYEKTKEVLKQSLYLSTIGLLMSLVPNIPRYFIEYFEGFEQLALFSTVGYILVVGTLISSAVSDSIIYKLSKLVHEKNKTSFVEIYKKIIFYSILLLVFTVVASLVLSEKFATIIAPNNVKETVSLFFITNITVPIQILASIFMTILISLNFIKYQLIIYFFQVLFLATLCFYLIPKYGMIGASVSLLIMFFITCLVLLFVIKWRINTVYLISIK